MMATAITIERLAILIVAGGEGRRMGGCRKPFLPLGQESVLGYMLRRLRKLKYPIAIGLAREQLVPAWLNETILRDRFDHSGPLGSILSGLDWAASMGCDSLITLPGDTPFFPPDVITALLPAPKVASCDGTLHPLIASWPVASREGLYTMLCAAQQASGGRGVPVRDFARSIGASNATFSPSLLDAFLNINTPEEYEIALRRYGSLSDK